MILICYPFPSKSTDTSFMNFVQCTYNPFAPANKRLTNLSKVFNILLSVAFYPDMNAKYRPTYMLYIELLRNYKYIKYMVNTISKTRFNINVIDTDGDQSKQEE